MWRSCIIPRRFSRMCKVSPTSFIYFHPGKIEINSSSMVVRLKCTLIPHILPFLLALPHQAILTQLESNVPKCISHQKWQTSRPFSFPGLIIDPLPQISLPVLEKSELKSCRSRNRICPGTSDRSVSYLPIPVNPIS